MKQGIFSLSLFPFTPSQHPTKQAKIILKLRTYTALIPRRRPCRPCAEPVGSSAPRLTNQRDLEAFTRTSGAALSLFCQAQASPPPTVR